MINTISFYLLNSQQKIIKSSKSNKRSNMDQPTTNKFQDTVKLLIAQFNDMTQTIKYMSIKFNQMTQQIQQNEEITHSLKEKIHQHEEKHINLEKITHQQHQQIQLLKKTLNLSKQNSPTQEATSFLKETHTENLQLQQVKISQEQGTNQNQQPIKIQHKYNQQNPLIKISFWLNVLLKDQRYYTSLRQGSKVVTTQDEEKTLNFFFQNEQIKCMQLLYRASQHNFSIKGFHDKCDSIPNTLVLIQTDHERKIGGYTPLTWESTQNYMYKKDENQETFIFSLTHGDKLTLKQERKAIANNPDQGPVFGELKDLAISKNANKNFDSCAMVCGSFTNPNYTFGNNDSMERFTGNPYHSQNFRIAEWQVWRIQFL